MTLASWVMKRLHENPPSSERTPQIRYPYGITHNIWPTIASLKAIKCSKIRIRFSKCCKNRTKIIHSLNRPIHPFSEIIYLGNFVSLQVLRTCFFALLRKQRMPKSPVLSRSKSIFVSLLAPSTEIQSTFPANITFQISNSASSAYSAISSIPTLLMKVVFPLSNKCDTLLGVISRNFLLPSPGGNQVLHFLHPLKPNR